LLPVSRSLQLSATAPLRSAATFMPRAATVPPAAEQRDELASSSWVEHGLLPGTRCASLPQAQDAPEAPAGPWGRPESF
jgi:hypothetical protein